jgi:hypothetical protein
VTAEQIEHARAQLADRDPVLHLVSVAVQHHLTTEERPELLVPPPAVRSIRASALTPLVTMIRVETDQGVRHFEADAARYSVARYGVAPPDQHGPTPTGAGTARAAVVLRAGPGVGTGPRGWLPVLGAG